MCTIVKSNKNLHRHICYFIRFDQPSAATTVVPYHTDTTAHAPSRKSAPDRPHRLRGTRVRHSPVRLAATPPSAHHQTGSTWSSCRASVCRRTVARPWQLHTCEMRLLTFAPPPIATKTRDAACSRSPWSCALVVPTVCAPRTRCAKAATARCTCACPCSGRRLPSPLMVSHASARALFAADPVTVARIARRLSTVTAPSRAAPHNVVVRRTLGVVLDAHSHATRLHTAAITPPSSITRHANELYLTFANDLTTTQLLDGNVLLTVARLHAEHILLAQVVAARMRFVLRHLKKQQRCTCSFIV